MTLPGFDRPPATATTRAKQFLSGPLNQSPDQHVADAVATLGEIGLDRA